MGDKGGARGDATNGEGGESGWGDGCKDVGDGCKDVGGCKDGAGGGNISFQNHHIATALAIDIAEHDIAMMMRTMTIMAFINVFLRSPRTA
jgi:hypothetical protein